MRFTYVLALALEGRSTSGTRLLLWLLCIAFPAVTQAQVAAHIWHADTAWYDEQLAEYSPFDIPVRVFVRNVGTDTARDVRVQFFSPEALMFEDKLLTRAVDVIATLPPGDSVDVFLDMKQNIRSGGRLYQPPQLYWIIEWKDGISNQVRIGEGHGIAMKLGDCEHGILLDDIVTELTLPDTLVLDPGDDSGNHVFLEVPCKVYSNIGRPLLMKDVTLDVDGEVMFREPIGVQRLLPSGSLDSLMVRDTLLLHFRITIPTSLVSTDLIFHPQPGIYLDQGCGYVAAFDGGRRIPVHVVHLPKRRISFTQEIADIGMRGPEMHIRIGSWCGERPVEINGKSITITESGEPMDILRYNLQEYSVDNASLRFVFAIDLSPSMEQDGALHLAKELVRHASLLADPRRDSIVLYTLTNHARHHPSATDGHASLLSVLDSLQVMSGTEVFPAFDEVVEQEIRIPHEGKVLMYLITDGWQSRDYSSLNTYLRKAQNHGMQASSISPVRDYNRNVVSQYYLPMDIKHDVVRWRTSKHGYSWGFLSYPISCANGVERQFELAISDWCGTDTMLTGQYSLPDLNGKPRELRLQAEEIRVISGQSFALSFSYAIPKTFTWNRTEFVLAYDTLLLRLDSVGTTHIPPGGFSRLDIEPGAVHFEYTLDYRNGSGTIAPFYFTTFASLDSVRTSIRCTPWARYAKCIPGYPAEIPVTAVPISTGIDASVAVREFEIVDLYPQPASGHLTLTYRCGIAAAYSVGIMDLLGRVVWRGEMQVADTGSGEFAIPLRSTLPSGTYILQIWTPTQVPTTVRPLARRFLLE